MKTEQRNYNSEMEMSWFENKLILCGPYVGDLSEELLTFRPFVY